MIDSRLPRFSQAVQALLLAVGFLLDLRLVVPFVGLILLAAVLGGPRWNLLAYLYKALPIAPGELEPAAPNRFAQTLGTVFLGIATVVLYAARPQTGVWWVLGWGPALAVAMLAAIAASTSF
jgi:hypothetical protein